MMLDNITWIGLDVSEALEKSIRFSFDNFESKFDKIASCQANVTYNESQAPCCEVSFFVFMNNGKQFISKAVSLDMYSSISEASSKMMVQLLKSKGKTRK